MVDSNIVWVKLVVGWIINVYFGLDGWVYNIRVKIVIGEYNYLVIKIVVIYFVEGYDLWR